MSEYHSLGNDLRTASKPSNHLRSQGVAGGSLYCTGNRQPMALLTWRPGEETGNPSENIEAAYRKLEAHLVEHSMVVLLERIFATRESAGWALDARANGLRNNAAPFVLPPTLIEGVPCSGGPVAGIHLVAAKPADHRGHRLVEWQGKTTGLEVETDHTRFLSLSDVSDLLPDVTATDRATETEQALLLASEILRAKNLSFHDVQRTWFYLNDILSWYDDFNHARNSVFDRLGLQRDGTMVIPASTGISGVGLRGSACILDVLATGAAADAPHQVTRLLNPKQNEAPEYGSAFSRGLRVVTDDSDLVFVSGTASIDDDGLSTNQGDFTAQTTTSIETVASLLGTVGASIADIAQATVFVKNPKDVPELHRILSDFDMHDLPILCTIADVCREELLFEIDATVVL